MRQLHADKEASQKELIESVEIPVAAPVSVAPIQSDTGKTKTAQDEPQVMNPEE
jgi:hypothetical protein